MDPDPLVTMLFVSQYPVLFHLADARSWPSIERHGLLSAAEIVRRWQVPPERAEVLLTRKRPKPPVELPHPELGVAVLRDQHPLNEDRLAPALTDGSVAHWLRRLSSFVFFFPDRDRAMNLYSAYQDTPAVLLTVRTRSLVQEHGANVRFATMNTGYTGRKVKERGADTFLPIRRYTPSARVQEVVVQDEVSDLRDHLISAEPLPTAG